MTIGASMKMSVVSLVLVFIHLHQVSYVLPNARAPGLVIAHENVGGQFGFGVYTFAPSIVRVA